MSALPRLSTRTPPRRAWTSGRSCSSSTAGTTPPTVCASSCSARAASTSSRRWWWRSSRRYVAVTVAPAPAAINAAALSVQVWRAAGAVVVPSCRLVLCFCRPPYFSSQTSTNRECAILNLDNLGGGPERCPPNAAAAATATSCCAEHSKLRSLALACQGELASVVCRASGSWVRSPLGDKNTRVEEKIRYLCVSSCEHVVAKSTAAWVWGRWRVQDYYVF